MDSNVQNQLDSKTNLINSWININQPESMGITLDSTMDDILTKLTTNTFTVVFVDSSKSTPYVKFLNDAIGNDGLYGHMFIYRTPNILETDTYTIYFVLVSYVGNYIYYNTYSTIQNVGWGPYWRKITQENCIV